MGEIGTRFPRASLQAEKQLFRGYWIGQTVRAKVSQMNRLHSVACLHLPFAFSSKWLELKAVTTAPSRPGWLGAALST